MKILSGLSLFVFLVSASAFASSEEWTCEVTMQAIEIASGKVLENYTYTGYGDSESAASLRLSNVIGDDSRFRRYNSNPQIYRVDSENYQCAKH